MISAQNTFTLVNQQNGNLAFKLFQFEDYSLFDHIQRHNYFSLLWIMEGSGELKADFSEYTCWHFLLINLL
jgi:AraC family transcriptional activator of pobA